MNIKNLFQNIKNAFNPQEELQDEAVIKFMRILENAHEEQMSCDEFFKNLDEFVDREVKSKDAEKIMPLVREHIEHCSECCDEYYALLNILEHTKE